MQVLFWLVKSYTGLPAVSSCSFLTLLRACKVFKIETSLIAEILCHVHGLISDGANFVFMWIPGHVGLADYSAADSTAKTALLLPASHSDYKSFTRIQTLRQWQLRGNSETENKLHSIEPRLNVITMLRLSSRDEIFIHRLRIGHTYLTHGHFLRRETNLGAWLVKWIELLSISCFIVFPLQMLVIIFSLLLWPPCLNCFAKVASR